MNNKLLNKFLFAAFLVSAGTWKIEDIKYDGGYSLVKLLKENSSSKSDNKKRIK